MLQILELERDAITITGFQRTNVVGRAGLLKLTRMKLTGQLEMERFSLKNCVFNALAAVQTGARNKSIEVTHAIDSTVDEIPGEAVLIEETLTNLLFNAVKYTPAGGKVEREGRGCNVCAQ